MRPRLLLALTFVLFACGTAVFPQIHQSQSDPATTAAALDQLLQSKRYLELGLALPRASGLKPEQRAYFEGALALRENRLDDAGRALLAAVNTRDPDLAGQARDTARTSEQVYQGLEMLAIVNLRLYQYGGAAHVYDLIAKVFGPKMSDGGAGVKARRHTAAVFNKVAPQTVSFNGEATVKRTAAGYPVQVGDKTFFATLDTGATFSQISESTAQAWGVQPLEGSITAHGYGGLTYQIRPGVIPALRIGSAEIHNVAVGIAADKDLYIEAIHYQLSALLGYPVISALGRLSYQRDGSLTMAAQSTTRDEGARLWLGDESLLVSLNTQPNGGPASERLFMLDTGSRSTYFTQKYFAENKDRFPGQPSETAKLAGGGGVHQIPAYPAVQLPLWAGSARILCHGQHILTAAQGGEPDNYYGVIGQDLLQGFSSYTIDLRSMRFSVRP